MDQELIGMASSGIEPIAQQNLDDENICYGQSIVDEQEIRIDEKECTLTPQVGMGFDSLAEVKTFYKDFAYDHGFGVVVRNSKEKRNKVETVRYHTFICEKGGKARRTSKNILFSQPSIKTDCKAKLNVKELENGKVVILKVIFDHNHGLSPSKSRHLKSHKKIDSWVKRRLELNDQAGIPVNKNFQSLVIQAGGYDKLSFDEKKARNNINEARRLRFGVGDAESLNNYFIQMQKKNSNFFYALDLTEDGRIRNIFWADARSRALYESFGDAITFDTTYLTNKYDMPFAPFVGVNHHGQSILLGCGLLSNEEMNTYVWLFETWLKCMSGVPPKAIVTDQCKSIGGAVAKVFNEAKHRLCLWHIMRKIPSKLMMLKDYKPLKKVLKKIVYESLTVEEFEENWSNFVSNFNLGGHDWLGSLYEIRKQWVPVFIKETFWAGMSTTQRSESMNSFFDDYVNYNTSLKQFVEQYENALKDKVEKELIADSASFHSVIPRITQFHYETQYQEAYTTDIFKMFQEELRGLMCCNAQLVKTEGSMCIYSVTDSVERKDGSSRQVVYDVYFLKDECDINCVCHWFDFKGMLCRHALSVLNLNGVREIPSRYILTRWRKDIKRKHNFIKSSYGETADREQVRRYDMLCDRFHSLAFIGSMRDDNSKLLMEAIDNIEEKFEREGVSDSDSDSKSEAINLNNILKSPFKVRGKGRPRFKRIESKVEEIVKIAKKKGSSEKPTQKKESVRVTKNKGSSEKPTEKTKRARVTKKKDPKEFTQEKVHETSKGGQNKIVTNQDYTTNESRGLFTQPDYHESSGIFTQDYMTQESCFVVDNANQLQSQNMLNPLLENMQATHHQQPPHSQNSPN